MVEIRGTQKLLSVTASRRFGVFCLFGTSQCGFTHFGSEDIYYIPVPFGVCRFGIDELGDTICLSGIYRTDNVTGETKHYREPYYITKNPRTIPQQLNRLKYADAVASWKVLTDEQKAEYNYRARHYNLYGYHLYIKDYMLSH
jgi:hypothetical protein